MLSDYIKDVDSGYIVIFHDFHLGGRKTTLEINLDG